MESGVKAFHCVLESLFCSRLLAVMVIWVDVQWFRVLRLCKLCE
jgi:hypothetical protein